MKLYCKIKRDGIWSWMVADDPWKVATARALCECRVCRPGKPEIVSHSEDCGDHELGSPCCDEMAAVARRKDSTSGVE